MRGIILAAGKGSRLGSIIKNSHKSLIKINKTKNLLENIIKNFKENKINDICIITGHNRNIFKKYKYKSFFNDCWDKSNMVYSLMKADTWLSKYSCIISYSDIFYENKAIELLKKSEDKFAILNNKNWHKSWTARYKNPLCDLESFKIDSHKNLTEIGNREKKITNIQGQYMGLIKITPSIWKLIKKKIPEIKKMNNLSITELLNRLIKNNFKIRTIEYKKKWFEIDNKSDLKFFFKKNK